MKLNGIEIPTPFSDVQIEEMEAAKEAVMASGKLVKDIISVRYNFTLQYRGLLPADALTFINIRNIGEPVTFEYEDVMGIHSTEVYIQPLPRSIYHPKPQYTKDITVILREVQHASS